MYNFGRFRLKISYSNGESFDGVSLLLNDIVSYYPNDFETHVRNLFSDVEAVQNLLSHDLDPLDWIINPVDNDLKVTDFVFHVYGEFEESFELCWFKKGINYDNILLINELPQYIKNSWLFADNCQALPNILSFQLC